MTSMNIFNWSGEVVDQLEMPDFLMQEQRPDLIHSRVVYEGHKARSGTHHTKGISEISGSTRKRRRQKGGGTARQGSGYDAQFRGGAVIFGPLSRKHDIKMNKKTLRAALRSLLSMKNAEGNIVILEDFAMQSHKTSNLINALGILSDKVGAVGERDKALFVFGEGDSDIRNLQLASRNLHFVNSLPACGMNAVDMMKSQKIFLSMKSVNEISMRLSA